MATRQQFVEEVKEEGMVRRKTVNETGIERIEGISAHDAWVGFVCIKCGGQNHIKIGLELLTPSLAFQNGKWKCSACGYTHSRASKLPFKNWPLSATLKGSLPAERFWIGFFRIATEFASSYWKQCNACGRVLPHLAFSKHTGWGPLELQMECRGCKGAINAILNPKRTAQQLHESAIRRRVADVFLQGTNQTIDIQALFRRFNAKCFKCEKSLGQLARKTWEIDHIIPSRFLYPLTLANAALLCSGCNNSKHGRWPSDFYTNNELIQLSKLTGADLSLLASPTPIVNSKIDVNAGVARYLTVRERSNLAKRIKELKLLISEYNLIEELTIENKKRLGFK